MSDVEEEAELAMEACDEDFLYDEERLENELSEEDQNKVAENKNAEATEDDIINDMGEELTVNGQSEGFIVEDPSGASNASDNPMSHNGSSAEAESSVPSEILEQVSESAESLEEEHVNDNIPNHKEHPHEAAGHVKIENNGEVSSALPESERAIEIDRPESENIGETNTSQDAASNDVLVDKIPLEEDGDDDNVVDEQGDKLPISETVEADLSLVTPSGESQPKESCASRVNADDDEHQRLNNVQQISNQDITTQHSTTTNMQLTNSNCSHDEQSLSPLEIPSKSNTDCSQNNTESSTQHRTTSNVDSEDDTLLSELDDLLQNKSSEDLVSNSSTITSDLPNGLRRDAMEAVNSKKLLLEMEELRAKCSRQEQELERIQTDCSQKEGRIRQLMQSSQVSTAEVMKEKETSTKAHILKIKELEVVIEQYKQDVQMAKDRQITHDQAAKKAIAQLQHEMILRVDQVKKLYEESVKEKETMVIRYAKSEKEVMDQKKAREAVEHKLREVMQSADALQGQIKQLRRELSKLKNTTEFKENESSTRQKEVEQLKEEISSQAIKVKWAQNKLKTELDAHKETKVVLGKTELKLKEAKEETEQIRRNCQEMIKTYQESEEIKSNSLDHKLKEREAELETHLQDKHDQMEIHQAKLRELETLKKRYHDNMAELDSLQVKTKCLEDERIQNETILSKFKELLNSQKDENRRLTKRIDELKAVHNKLQDAEEEVKKMETDISGQKEEFSDLESELESSKKKETELLQFTEKITAKNTQLNSDNTALSNKVDEISTNLKKLQEKFEELKTQHNQVTLELKQEKQYRERESTMLSSRLSEKAKAVEQLSIQLEDARDEMKTIKRKNLANVKDLSRQLQQAQKRLDSDSKDGSPKDNISLGSRTSSSGSLDTLPNANGGSSINASNSSSHINSAVNNTRFEEHHQPTQDQPTVAIAGNDYPGIDKNMLVERIVKLQRAQQRKNEKIEFMQEHVNSLVEEIKKKSKIIQQYVLREEAGALSSEASDANKAQMSKQTGIMSSLYSSKATDKSMTLDLSLEINRKLQAVLEDTLLKNITLKENIDTLGTEIAHLSRKLEAVQQQRQQQRDQMPKRK